MKLVIVLIATVMLALSSCAAPIAPAPPDLPTQVAEPSPPVTDGAAKAIIPPKYTVEEVLAIAKKLSPECMAKKGEPTGH